jgi:hypothetical protein
MFINPYQNVVYYDSVAGDVYVSQNDGENWKFKRSTGQAIGFVAHPFHHRTVCFFFINPA